MTNTSTSLVPVCTLKTPEFFIVVIVLPPPDVLFLTPVKLPFALLIAVSYDTSFQPFVLSP